MAKTGNSYTTGTTTDGVEIPTTNPGFSITASPNKLSPSDCDNGNGNVAAKTGNTYISGTMTDRMTTATEKSGVFDHGQLEETDPDDCDNEQQPEMTT